MDDLKIVKGIFDIGFNIFDRYEKWAKLRNKTDVKIRLLYLECRRNLALIDCIPEEGGDLKTLFQIVQKLETNVLEMVFMEDDGNKNFINALMKSGEDSKKREPEKRSKTILGIGMSLYVRVYILKRLFELHDAKSKLKNIRYEKRLKNIKDSYRSMVLGLYKTQAMTKIVKDEKQIEDDINSFEVASVRYFV